MGHTCGHCGQACYCNGDIEDMLMGEPYDCIHCEDWETDEWADDDDFEFQPA